MSRWTKPLVLFGIGGLTYVGFELVYRGYSHWTMFLVGGIAGYLIGIINEIFPWEMPLWKQILIGSSAVTVLEFIAGCIINLWLKWDVWDYSELPFNILGQVCPQFFFIWMVLVLIWIIADDYLRYWIFKEEKPRYQLF